MNAANRSYLRCDFCKFTKYCIRMKNGKWLCSACLRTDLTDKEKLGNRMHPFRGNDE